MGTLRRVASDRVVIMPVHMLVGRSGHADLRLDGPGISSEHAALAWNGREWQVRDLSRNGTMLDGLRLKSREEYPLVQGQVLAFGEVEEAWVLDDDAPPVAMGVHHSSGRVVCAIQGVLPLPDEDDPRATLSSSGEVWWLTVEGKEPEPVQDRHLAIIDGQGWILRVPEPVLRTDEARDSPQIDEFKLRLAVSRDGETIVVDLFHGDERVGLKSKSHHEVLLLLARQLIDDRASGLPEIECGWVEPDLLARQAGLKRSALNVYVMRLRREFDECGLVSEQGAIERRASSWALRLVPLAVDVVELGVTAGS